MTDYVKARWTLLGPRVRALLASLSVPVALVGVAVMPEWLALIASAVWFLLVLAGIAAAAWEHRRDLRRDLRSWRTVPHPDPCPHCRSGVCLFPPSRYGLAQAPDAHLWDENGRRIGVGIAGRLLTGVGEN